MEINPDNEIKDGGQGGSATPNNTNNNGGGRKKIVSIAVLIGAVLLLVLWGIKVYNNLVTKQESAQTAIGNIQTAYQRRADLIPNIVAAVESYKNYEGETLIAVTEARAKATSTTIDANNITAEQLQAFQAAQDGMSSALSRLLVAVEKYPDLKANTNYLDLHSKLESCENSIAQARKDYNDVAKDFNTYGRRFPNNIISGMYHFDKMPYFEAVSENAEVAPDVNSMLND